MSPQYENIFNEAMKLPLEDQQLLAKRLELSIFGLSEKEIEDAWIKTADERLQQYEEGKITAWSVNETIERLRRPL